MKDVQRKIIFGMVLFLIITSLILPVFLIYRLDRYAKSPATTRAGVSGSINLTVSSSCGDGVCDAGSETCSTCANDCGACASSSTTTSAGGGGGGGGVVLRKANFLFEPDLIEEKLVQGESALRLIKVKNVGQITAKINLKVENVESLVFINKDEFSIKKGGSEDLEVSILTSEAVEPGVYLGDVVGKTADLERRLQIVLSVIEKWSLIEVKVAIPEDKKSVKPGDKVDAELTIINKFNNSILASLEYSMKDKDEKLLVSKKEQVELEPGENIFKRQLNTDKKMAPEYYFFYATVSYDLKDYEDAAAFRIASSESPRFGLSTRDMILAVILIAFLGAVVIIYMFRHRLFDMIRYGKRRISLKKKEQVPVDREKIISITLSKLVGLKLLLSKRMYAEDMLKTYFEVIRYFFSNYYSIKYSYTYQELTRELTSRKIKHKLKVLSFVKNISDVSYYKTLISKTDFVKLLNRTILIVKSLKPNQKEVGSRSKMAKRKRNS